MTDQIQPQEPPVFSREDFSKRCLGNAELMERVLAAFTSGAASDIDALKNAIHEQDRVLTAKTAHRIKGSASNAAAYRMSSIAAQIERDAPQEPAESLNTACIQLLESFENFLDACQGNPTDQDHSRNATQSPPSYPKL